MKKKVLMTILLIVLASVMVLGSVKAANYGMNLSANIDNTTVTVKLSITNPGDGVEAVQGNLYYDSSKLEFVEMKAANSNWKDPDYASSTGIFTVLMKGQTITEASDVIEITFKVKDSATGKMDIQVNNIALSDKNDQKVTIPDASTSVTINNEENKNNTTTDNTTTVNNTTENTNKTNTTSNTTKTNSINTNKTNSTKTTSNTKIPNTGISTVIFYVIGAVAIIAIGSAIRYKSLQK